MAFQLDHDAYAWVCRLLSIENDYAAARAFGIERSVISRVRKGTTRPGNRFMAGTMAALVNHLGVDLGEAAYRRLYVLVSDPAPHRHRPAA